MQKKYFVLVLVLLFAAFVVFSVRVLKKNDGNNSGNNPGDKLKQEIPAAPVAYKELGSKDIPKDFPANFPWEKNATVVKSFEVQNPSTGKIQYTRVYISGKTMDQNFTLFQKYLKDNAWSMSGSLDQPEIKNLNATKAKAQFDITINKAASGKIEVTVNFIR